MPEVQKWKPSFFNVTLDRNERRLIFNSSTTKMIDLDRPQAELLEDSLEQIGRSGQCANESLLQCLISLGFVVPEEENEYERERIRFQTTKASRETLRVTIAPTMACNLRCSYCFQQNLVRGKSMKPDVQQGVIDFIQRKLEEGSKRLVVQWFGGEPLLAFKQIVAMSAEFQSICTERGIAYYSEMLTNGTLLSAEMIDGFRRIALKAIQIPMDGTVGTYARRKNVSVERANGFHRFLIGHLQSLVDVTGSVTIRINVDRDNPEGGKDVVRMFKDQGVVDPRIDFRLGFLNTSRGLVECIPHDCFSPAQFSNVEVEFMHFLASEGYRVYGSPSKRNFPCAAPLSHSYTIDPEGRIGKCVPAIGTEESIFSRIYPHDIKRTLLETSLPEAPYGKFDPFSSGVCEDCKLLPVCLGSCPKMHEPGRTAMCSMKEGLLDRLRFHDSHPD